MSYLRLRGHSVSTTRLHAQPAKSSPATSQDFCPLPETEAISTRTPPEHPFLTSETYYYHLATQPDDPNYRICVDFGLWSFSHDHLPPSWARTTPIDDEGPQGTHWSEINSRIKRRDLNCRVSGWADNKSTAHIVPKEQMNWMETNGMEVYAAMPDAFMHQDCRNLFALRWDLHTSQFDSGKFVIVPIGGRMVTHFIGPSRESAAHYHNNNFDSSHLSHEFLFARFAWAIIKKAHSLFMSQTTTHRKAFRLLDAPSDEQEEGIGSDDGDGDGPIDPPQKSGITSGRKGKGTKRKRPDRGDPAPSEAHELEKDIATAKRVAPFFRSSTNPFFPS